MMRGTILKLLAMAYILRSPDEGGGGGVADSTPAAPVEVERPDHITEEEWLDLSPAEREAQVETDEGEGAHTLHGEDVDDEDGEFDEETLKAISGEAGDDETLPAKTAEELAAEAAALEQIAGAGGTPVGDETPADDISVTDESLLAWRAPVSDAEVPIPKAVPAELKAKLDELDAKLTEADEWFEKGEKPDETPFTKADLRALERQVNAERQDINDDILQHRLTLRESAKEDLVWNKEQAAFKAARPDLFKNRVIEGALVTITNDLLKDPKNASKPGMQILIEAERIVRKELSLPAKGKTAEQAKTPEAEKKPAAAKRQIPPNLSKVPVADANETGNPFSAILRLSGEKYEKAIESMAPTRRAQFENWANKQA